MGWEWMVYYPPQDLVSSSWQASCQQLGFKNAGDNKSLSLPAYRIGVYYLLLLYS